MKITATCSACGYSEQYKLSADEEILFSEYAERGRSMGRLQDLFPRIPAWIRSGAIDQMSGGFCICPVCAGAETVKTRHDFNIPGWGFIPRGSEFPINRANKKLVYVELKPRVILRLARKGDCEFE